MQELDIGSGRGAALLQDIAERHGPGLASVARWPSRIFLLRSPFADAFHFVGAVVEPARAMPDARAQAQLSVGGSGLSLVDALTGCLGECAERLSQVDGPGIEMISAPLNDVHQRVDAAVVLGYLRLEVIDRAVDCVDLRLGLIDGQRVGRSRPEGETDHEGSHDQGRSKAEAAGAAAGCLRESGLHEGPPEGAGGRSKVAGESPAPEVPTVRGKYRAIEGKRLYSAMPETSS